MNIKYLDLMEMINQKEKIILLISASWCGESEMTIKSFKNVSNMEEFKSYKFLILDQKEKDLLIDSLSKEIDILPTIIEFNNSIEIKRLTNFSHSKKIMDFINND